MRRRVIPGIIGLSLLSSSCGPLYNTSRTLVAEPVAYCDSATKLVELNRNYKRAKEALAGIERDCGRGFSEDYACGFEEGYIDYLYAGPRSAPPPLPPRCYWKPKYQTPEGYRAVEQWFAGFAHGVEVARTSGYREYAPVPAALLPKNTGRGVTAANLRSGVSDPVPPTTPEPMAPPTGEQLPPPQPGTAPMPPQRALSGTPLSPGLVARP